MFAKTIIAISVICILSTFAIDFDSSIPSLSPEGNTYSFLKGKLDQEPLGYNPPTNCEEVNDMDNATLDLIVPAENNRSLRDIYCTDLSCCDLATCPACSTTTYTDICAN